MSAENFLRGLSDDGLFTPSIKPHSLEKIQRHNYYARLFSASMKAKWPQRAYVGLYSGAGRARIEATEEILETTAMSVVRQPDPFTHYIFVDNDSRCVEALRARIAAAGAGVNAQVIAGDAADLAPVVRRALPPYSKDKGLLSFCFVDPFNANLKFDIFRQLGDLRMDFLVLLMLGYDARLNFQQYYEDRASTRIAELVDCADWREQWDATADKNVIRFLLQRFNEAMMRLGYLESTPDMPYTVKAAGKEVVQYVLAFYSKHKVAHGFWKDTLAGSTDQFGLGL